MCSRRRLKLKVYVTQKKRERKKRAIFERGRLHRRVLMVRLVERVFGFQVYGGAFPSKVAGQMPKY